MADKEKPESKQPQLPGLVNVKEGWRIMVRQLPNGHTRFIATKTPSKAK